jgi:hypothetical protein
MTRPYLRYSLQDIRTLFENSRNDSKVLKAVLEELKHRTTKGAQALKKEVEECLNKDGNDAGHNEPSSNRGASPKGGAGTTFEAIKSGPSGKKTKTPPTNDEQAFPHDFRLVEPIGTAVGHPQKRIFPLKNDVALELPPDTPTSRRYAVALRMLIEEMERKGVGRQSLTLENGQAVNAEGPQKAYQFEYDGTVDLFEGATVFAQIGHSRSRGLIVGVMQGSIIVSLDNDYGDQISICVLSVDNTAMLEALAKRLETLEEGEAAGFNSKLANAVVTNALGTSGQPIVTKIAATGLLNERQQAAVGMALENKISYIWGPPGTGKTRSLGELVKILFEQEKRVLICSNTNQAVDQVLLKLCETMGTSHPAIEDGRIVRIGRVANERLAHDWSPYVTVSGIIDRKSKALRERLREIEAQVRPLREKVSRIDGALEYFDELEAAKRGKQKRTDEIEALQKRLDLLYREAKNLPERLSALDTEFGNLKDAGLLRRAFMRSEETILRDRQRVAEQLMRNQKAVESAERENSYAREEIRKVENRIAELQKKIPAGTDNRKKLETEKAELENKLQPLLGEIAAINKKLADMEATIVQEARIIGATVTKTYLSPKQFTGFDTVIIDEASMVMLPALYSVAGLASNRVVVSGDFRQLPPIVQTDQRELFEAIGVDVFKATGITDAVENGESPPEVVMLNRQYRMQKPICDLISSAMYQGRLESHRDDLFPRGHPPSPFDQTLTVIDTSRIWPFVNRDAFGKRYNLMHALAIRNLCLHLCERGFVSGPGDVGVATPYSAQAMILRRILKGSGLERIISAGTVHRYQGDEKHLMILDIPDSLGEPKVGIFLEADNPQDPGASLFTVGISRAKDYLVVLANLTYLQDKLPDHALLRDILYSMQTHGRIVDVQAVLELRPVLDDLKHLDRHSTLKLDDLEKSGLFRQKEFDAVCRVDIENAKESVAIFSGFVTPQRVASYGDLFRRKLSEEVAIRCVTRPPHANGSIPQEQGKQALDALEGLGCIVDTRLSAHEKVVIIDDRIVWFGSLNMLSHTTRTDEMMVRIDNAEVAAQLAIFMSLSHVAFRESGKGLSTRKENRKCPKCQSRAYYAKGRYGPFWSCEECNWRESFDRPRTSRKASSSNHTPNKEQLKRGPKCPKCGAPMKRRTGPHGEFYGCSNYPKCRGKASA